MQQLHSNPFESKNVCTFCRIKACACVGTDAGQIVLLLSIIYFCQNMDLLLSLKTFLTHPLTSLQKDVSEEALVSVKTKKKHSTQPHAGPIWKTSLHGPDFLT